MSPETKKTLIYGGVISFAIAVGLYIYSQHQAANEASNGQSPDAAAAQAQADAQAAANQEIQLAEIQSLGSGSLSAPTLGNEAPPDNFAEEVKQILEAAGLGAPAAATPAAGATPPPTAGLPQPAQPVDGSPAIKAQPVGPEPGPARTFDHLLADTSEAPNYPTTVQ